MGQIINDFWALLLQSSVVSCLYLFPTKLQKVISLNPHTYLQMCGCEWLEHRLIVCHPKQRYTQPSAIRRSRLSSPRRIIRHAAEVGKKFGAPPHTPTVLNQQKQTSCITATLYFDGCVVPKSCCLPFRNKGLASWSWWWRLWVFVWVTRQSPDPYMVLN